MKCVAVTPERTVFEQTVNFVVLPLWDGEYGVEASLLSSRDWDVANCVSGLLIIPLNVGLLKGEL